MFRKNRRKLMFEGRIGIIGAVALWVSFCIAVKGSQKVTLAWDASQASDVAGYVLHYGTASQTYTSRIDAGTNTQLSVDGLDEGLTYYFALTAYNSARIESPPSGEIVYIAPGLLTIAPGLYPGSPFYLKFPVAPGHWYEIEASVDLKSWITIEQTDTSFLNTWFTFQDLQSSDFPMRFYRLADHLSSDLPPPEIQSIDQNGPNIDFTWNAVVGQTYQVQYQGTFGYGPSSSAWNNLGGAIVATNSSETASFFFDLGLPWYFWTFRIILAVPTPPPVFTSVTQTNGLITFTWRSVAEQTYQIQYTSNLFKPNWNNLGGVISAFGSTTTAYDLIGPDPQRFYRVVLPASLPVPPPVFQSVAVTNSAITFTWSTVPGLTYDVQYTTSLDPPYWSDWSGPITAYSSTMTLSDFTGFDPQRFYRVLMYP